MLNKTNIYYYHYLPFYDKKGCYDQIIICFSGFNIFIRTAPMYLLFIERVNLRFKIQLNVSFLIQCYF